MHPIPGVIDSDYTGEIKITLQPPTKAVQIPAGWRVAQVLLPFRVRGQAMQTRGEGCFGASNLVFWVEEVKKNRPFKEITTGQVIKGLLDTRADSLAYWHLLSTLDIWDLPPRLLKEQPFWIGRNKRIERFSSLT